MFEPRVLLMGIIPAYAGNTFRRQHWDSLRRDHPRVCGEHLDRAVSRLREAGSSPRMRGTPSFAAFRIHVAGIIPAYAGNTR